MNSKNYNFKIYCERSGNEAPTEKALEIVDIFEVSNELKRLSGERPLNIQKDIVNERLADMERTFSDSVMNALRGARLENLQVIADIERKRLEGEQRASMIAQDVNNAMRTLANEDK